MARVISSSNIQWRGRGVSYPWNEWFDGKTRMLSRGEDFDAKVHSMRTLAYKRAAMEGVRIRTKIMGDDKIALQRLG